MIHLEEFIVRRCGTGDEIVRQEAKVFTGLIRPSTCANGRTLWMQQWLFYVAAFSSVFDLLLVCIKKINFMKLELNEGSSGIGLQEGAHCTLQYQSTVNASVTGWLLYPLCRARSHIQVDARMHVSYTETSSSVRKNPLYVLLVLYIRCLHSYKYVLMSSYS
jgi:hypothetical protein